MHIHFTDNMNSQINHMLTGHYLDSSYQRFYGSFHIIACKYVVCLTYLIDDPHVFNPFAFDCRKTKFDNTNLSYSICSILGEKVNIDLVSKMIH